MDNGSRSYSIGSIGALAGILMMQPACTSDGAAHGRVALVDRTTQALTSAELESVNGTYGAGCTDRTGAWSLEIAAGATLDNPELSVVLNDVSCVLTMTHLRTTAGAIAATPSIVLTTSYQVAASSFADPIEFYGNARLSAVDFADDFVLTVLYSDDRNLATDDNTANFEVVEATATAQSVDAPDYTIDASGLGLLTDANDVVQSAMGSAALTAGLVTGQNYVVVDAAGLDTYAELDAAFIAGTDEALPASIPAAPFMLVGDDLTVSQVRTVIIANTSNGVASYQAFEITFHAAL